MYKVYNKALDSVFSSYNVKDLYELSEDQLYKLAEELHISPAPKFDKKNRVIGNNRVETIDKIIKSKSLSFYMGRPFWSARHSEMADERELDSKLEKHEKGKETFEMFAEIGWGVSELKPGQSRELDLTPAYIEELKSMPVSESLTITNLDAPTGEPTVEEKELEVRKTYEGQAWNKLRDIARERNERLAEDKKIKLNLPTPQLIDALVTTHNL